MVEAEVTTGAAPAQTGFAVVFSWLPTVLRTPLYANAFYLWANTAATAVAGFAFWALAARLYDADEVGLGSAALSMLLLVATVSHLGLGFGLIRFLPESGARGSRLANAAFTASAGVAVLSSTIFLVGVPLWAPSLDFVREQPLHAAAFVSFAVASTVCFVQTHAFLGVRKAKYILVQVLLVQLSRLSLLAVMAAWFGAFGIVASMGIAGALGAVVGFRMLARGLIGYRPAAVFDPASVLKLLPFSVANHVADAMLVAPSLVLPLLVVSFLGPAEGAYFYMAWLLGYLLTSASIHLSMSLFAEGANDPRALHVLSRNAVAGGLVVAIVGAVFLLLLGDKLLLTFGHDYAREGAVLLRIVALGGIPAVVVNVYLGALRVTRRVGELVLIAGVVAVMTLAVSSALLGVMGLAGAGVGHVVGQGIGFAIVLSRLLTNLEGTMKERMRWVLGTLAGRSW
jgi:O-antigen/teichoic acid export membrane protein